LKKPLAICAALVLLAFGTAQAQSVYPGPGLPDRALPPYEIMSIVRSTGLAPLTRPMRRGPYYVLVAVDRVGRQMRVLVDAQLGDIVNLRPALAAGPYGPEMTRPNGYPGVGAPPDPTGATAPYGAHPGGEYPQLPPAPRSIPSVPNNPRAANQPASAPTVALPPTRTAVGEPALPPPPPLPRPRPNLALIEAPPAAAPARPPAAAAPAATPSTVPAPVGPGGTGAAQPIE
jgi:hypothetical protein